MNKTAEKHPSENSPVVHCKYNDTQVDIKDAQYAVYPLSFFLSGAIQIKVAYIGCFVKNGIEKTQNLLPLQISDLKTKLMKMSKDVKQLMEIEPLVV